VGITTEERIVKIVRFDKDDNPIGICESDSEFKVFGTIGLNLKIEVGDYIEGYLLHDEDMDEYYIQSIFLSDEDDWNNQEGMYA